MWIFQPFIVLLLHSQGACWTHNLSSQNRVQCVMFPAKFDVARSTHWGHLERQPSGDWHAAEVSEAVSDETMQRRLGSRRMSVNEHKEP